MDDETLKQLLQQHREALEGELLGSEHSLDKLTNASAGLGLHLGGMLRRHWRSLLIGMVTALAVLAVTIILASNAAPMLEGLTPYLIIALVGAGAIVTMEG